MVIPTIWNGFTLMLIDSLIKIENKAIWIAVSGVREKNVGEKICPV